jgi:hypothetical protein
MCKRLASTLRTNEAQIPDEWPMRPAFYLWPPKRHQAVLWILAQFIFFRTQYDTTTNLLAYYDFMRRKRWKAYQQSKRQDKLGNYLSVLYGGANRLNRSDKVTVTTRPRNSCSSYNGRTRTGVGHNGSRKQSNVGEGGSM